jgi:hypothetical protein
MYETLEKTHAAEEILREFRQEIQAKIDSEIAKKKEGALYNPHLENIRPECLDGFEEKLYRELTSGTLTEQRLSELRKAAWSHYIPLYPDKAPEWQSLEDFWAYVRNEVIKTEARKIVQKKQRGK